MGKLNIGEQNIDWDGCSAEQTVRNVAVPEYRQAFATAFLKASLLYSLSRAVTSWRWVEWSVILPDVERHGSGLSLLLYIWVKLEFFSYPGASARNFFKHDSTVAAPQCFRLPPAFGCAKFSGDSGRFGQRGGEEDRGPEHSSGQNHHRGPAGQPRALCRPELHNSGGAWDGPAPRIHRSFGKPQQWTKPMLTPLLVTRQLALAC